MPRGRISFPKYVPGLCLLFWLCPHITAIRAQTVPAVVTKKYAADSVRAGIADLVNELSLNHPGLYRYHSKADFGRYVDSVQAAVTDSLTEPEIYRRLKPLIAYIGCLHTELYPSEAYTDYLNRSPNLFPFRLYFLDGKAYIVKNYSDDPSVPLGGELLEINGEDMTEVTRKLLEAVPSDGYNRTMKYRSLYHFFPLWYRSMISVTERFTFTVRQSGNDSRHRVAGKTYADMAEDGFLKETVYPKMLEFDITDGIGRLTVRSFSESDIRRGKQRFRPFIKHAFAELAKNGVRQLILDLRYNTGGSDANAAHLARYFFNGPYRYWSRIEVTETIARQIKGKYRLFYAKPVQADSTWLWKKAKTVREFDFYEVQRPAARPYAGQTYMLINGFCMSSCADFSAVLSYNKKAVVIGEETGGGFQGNNSGMMPVSTYAPTTLRLTVPLQKYGNAVDPSMHFGHGTIPDFPVTYTVSDIIKGEDKEMRFTLDLIKKQRGG